MGWNENESLDFCAGRVRIYWGQEAKEGPNVVGLVESPV